MPLRLREGEREKESGERRREMPCARALMKKNTNTGGKRVWMGLKIVGNLKNCGYLFLMAEWLNAP